MIDLHSHIVPGFDDGARSMEDALEMARMAADSGVTILAATSHGNLSQGDPGACLRDYRKRLAMLRREVRLAGIRLKLAGGMEILLTGETLRYAERHRLPGLRGGNWILAEFVFDIPQARARKRLEFLDRQGYQVILAHPERYDFVQRDPGCLREIVGERLLLQVNKGSLLGGLWRPGRPDRGLDTQPGAGGARRFGRPRPGAPHAGPEGGQGAGRAEVRAGGRPGSSVEDACEDIERPGL